MVAAPIQQASAEPTDEEVEAWKANEEGDPQPVEDEEFAVVGA